MWHLLMASESLLAFSSPFLILRHSVLSLFTWVHSLASIVTRIHSLLILIPFLSNLHSIPSSDSLTKTTSAYIMSHGVSPYSYILCQHVKNNVEMEGTQHSALIQPSSLLQNCPSYLLHSTPHSHLHVPLHFLYQSYIFFRCPSNISTILVSVFYSRPSLDL